MTVIAKNITIKVPNGVSIYVEHSSHNAGDIEISGVSSEIEITTNYHDITLDKVSGPMAIKTVLWFNSSFIWTT